jgi:hypothetical protein
VNLVQLQSDWRRAFPTAAVRPELDTAGWVDDVCGQALMAHLVVLALDIDTNSSARATVATLAGLLEGGLAEGEDNLREELANVVVDLRLCTWPRLLQEAWPFLGRRSREVVAAVLVASEIERMSA